MRTRGASDSWSRMVTDSMERPKLSTNHKAFSVDSRNDETLHLFCRSDTCASGKPVLSGERGEADTAARAACSFTLRVDIVSQAPSNLSTHSTMSSVTMLSIFSISSEASTISPLYTSNTVLSFKNCWCSRPWHLATLLLVSPALW